MGKTQCKILFPHLWMNIHTSAIFKVNTNRHQRRTTVKTAILCLYTNSLCPLKMISCWVGIISCSNSGVCMFVQTQTYIFSLSVSLSCDLLLGGYDKLQQLVYACLTWLIYGPSSLNGWGVHNIVSMYNPDICSVN